MVARIINHIDKAIGKGDCERKSCCDQAEENKTHWAYGSTQIGSAEAGRRNLGKDQEAPEPLEQFGGRVGERRSEEHTSELQSLMRITYAGFCLKKKKKS